MSETSAPGVIKLSKAAGIARVVVSNPAKRNALSLAMKRQLIDTFAVCEADADVRCIVLSGEGTSAFISGADISELKTARANPEVDVEYMKLTKAALMASVHSTKPVIASIRGACAGGGLQFAVSCDIRFAARSAFLTMPAARLGLAYPYVGFSMFLSLIGRGRTMDLFMSARRVPAEEALAIGLVDFVVDDDKLDQAVADYTAGVAANAPLTLRLAKAAVLDQTGCMQDNTPPYIQQYFDACTASEDFKEGQAAFTEKRKPVFKGR